MNWGTKLITGMIIFMAFIIFLVVKIVFSSEDALMDKNYYEKGQAYDTEYNAKERAIKDNVVPEVGLNQYGLTIRFAHSAHYKLICKRPSDAKMDNIFEGDTGDQRTVHIPKSKFEKGPWQLHLEYSIADTIYLFEKEIIVK